MLSTFFKDLSGDATGATAIEYGLIIALIAVAITVSLQGFAGESYELWTSIETDVDASIGNGPQTPPPD